MTMAQWPEKHELFDSFGAQKNHFDTFCPSGVIVQECEYWNVAVAEFEVDGGHATVTSGAATERDDAIQNVVDALAQQGIDGHRVVRLYSERKPSEAWFSYFASHWPRAAITWSFEQGQEAEFEAAIVKMRASKNKPWWKFW